MKFTTSKDAILRVLSVAQEVITNKSAISIMSNVLLQTDKENQKVIVKCTNSTINAISSFGAEIEEEGEITVFCDKFVSVISSLPMGDVEIETGENEILVKPLGKKVKFIQIIQLKLLQKILEILLNIQLLPYLLIPIDT